jgi:hypothetical protein
MAHRPKRERGNRTIFAPETIIKTQRTRSNAHETAVKSTKLIDILPRSFRSARYSAQELAAASESLLFGTVGDKDQHIPGNWLREDGVETSQQEPRQLPKRAAPSW